MTSQQFLILDSSTLANFKSWGQAMSTFIASQWTQTSDTGQINWTTVSLPAAGSTGGFEIYRPNDALTPIYLRIDYGRATSSSAAWFEVTIGTGTNGAGTLTGNVSAVHLGGQNNGNNASGGTSATWECDFSGSGSRLGLLLGRNAGSQVAKGFFVERSLDNTGAYTSTYMTLVTVAEISPGTNCTYQSTVLLSGLPFNVSAGAITNPVVITDTSTSCAANGGIAISPVFPSFGQFGNPMTCVASARGADIVDGTTFTSVLYGSTFTYLGTKGTNTTQYFGPNINSALVMRYD